MPRIYDVLPKLIESRLEGRVHVIFAPDPATVEIVPATMTRGAVPGGRLLNISSGGVMKDTWVLG